MEQKGEILLGPVGGMGLGGLLGLAVGFAVKKVGKFLLLAAGITFVLVQALVFAELIEIQWGALEDTMRESWQASGANLAERAWAMASNNLPFGGGFAAGFAMGFKIG